MLRIGFIGVGRIADMHYEGYRDNPRARLYAVCDTDPDLLARRASQWEVENTYDDYRRMLEDPSIDAVEVIHPATTCTARWPSTPSMQASTSRCRSRWP